MRASRILVVALGGHALIPAAGAGRIEEQFAVTATTCDTLAELVAGGIALVVTHGNGPIVGNILIRNEAARDRVPPMPLDVCGADSQGGIGYMIQQTLGNALRRRGLARDVVTLVTQVVVDPADPAFGQPTKPIGPFYRAEDAQRLAREKGWIVREDAGRGWRRVVPSPRPRDIVEGPVIARLVQAGVIVVAVGGGGIPVVPDGSGGFRGVEAVVDKDRAAAVLARQLGAERMMILTEVDAVYRDFGTPAQASIDVLTLDEAERMLEGGAFPPGSMGPKIESAAAFLRAGGEEVLITRPGLAAAALRGQAGTRLRSAPARTPR